MKLKALTAMGLTVAMCAGALAGCGGGSAATSGGETQYELTVSGIGGSLNWLPIYVAQQEGYFDEAGLSISEQLFTNGPVQMESLSADGWDIGCTGIGGVFAGVLGYDAVVLGASNTDDGTQVVFTRNDSDIVAAGTGNNSYSDEIYGSADTWKGKSVLCNTGSVTQYVFVKTLEGFGLTQSDVEFIAMDPATAYSAFVAGEGDACVLTGAGGTFRMMTEPDKYTAVSSGPLVDSGLMCHFVANKNSYADPEKYEAMKVFMKEYFRAMDWIKENPDQAVECCMAMNDENGSSMDEETTKMYVEADTYFTLDEAVAMMENKAEGSDVSEMEKNMEDVLEFFIQCGNYEEGDLEKFQGHTDSKLLTEVLAESESAAQ